MKVHADSHIDHGLTASQLSYVLKRFGDHRAFFKHTIELPEDLGTVPISLVGPLVGDPPVPEASVIYAKRGERAWASRMVPSDRPLDKPRSSRMVTVIAGPHDGEPCVLYTVYGGPEAPREPADVRQEIERLESERRALPDRSPENVEHAKIYARIEQLRTERDQSDAFWRDHALVI